MQQPHITVSDPALARINEVRANRKQPEAGVRIAITGRTSGAFTYDLRLVMPGSEESGDIVVEGSQGVSFHVPVTSAAYLDNVTLTVDGAGVLGVDNPNPLWNEPVAQAIQAFLDSDINPMVASHGGFIDLLDVSDGVAYVHMGGGCQGCGMAEVTLSQGVRVAIEERFPEITSVRDTTDHAQGSNPYYQATKK